jgi:hypothetical protein
LPHTTRRNKGYVSATAGRAAYAIRPAPCHKVIKAIIGIREVDNCVLKGLRFVAHEPSIPQEA